MAVLDFLASDHFFSRNMYSAIISMQWSWFFLLAHKFSAQKDKTKIRHCFIGYDNWVVERNLSPTRANASFAHCGKSNFRIAFLKSALFRALKFKFIFDYLESVQLYVFDSGLIVSEASDWKCHNKIDVSLI